MLQLLIKHQLENYESFFLNILNISPSFMFIIINSRASIARMSILLLQKFSSPTPFNIG